MEREAHQSQAFSKGYNKGREVTQVYFCFLGRSISGSFSSKNAGRKSRRRKLGLTVSPLEFCQAAEITLLAFIGFEANIKHTVHISI